MISGSRWGQTLGGQSGTSDAERRPARTEFLRSSDAFIWSIEGDAALRSTIVVLILLDRPPDWQELTNRFELLSQTVPMFRRRVAPSPGLAPPRWELDSEFDLAFHVRRVAAPAPGDLGTLLEMARIAAMADFDRARPLWESTLIEGLADGGAALLCKLNHALTDGVGAVALAATLYDRTEQYEERSILEIGAPPAAPPFVRCWEMVSGGIRYATDAFAASLNVPAVVAKGIRNPIGALTEACSTAASIWRTARPTRRPGSPIMLNRHKGRQVAIHQVPKDRLRRAGWKVGGSLNDAFIAAVTGGLRRYHEKHAAVAGSFVMTMPISVRTPHDPPGGNRATLIRLDVPVGVADAAHRIRIIHELTTKARGEKSLGYTQFIAGALRLAPRWYVRSALRNVDFIASDVPGFAEQIYLAGAAVRMQYAFSPTLGAAFNVTLLTYADACALGINVDTAAIPDVDVFHDCLVAGFDEVLELAC
ncbi:wax ester/triacylglycerol synthase domain-containing protein [Mycobacterium riyadhense]|uniref:wax ester/triacylglycerol synthase domain-containing protein n=1 Tax=Mycobacterium riyadhense TaxID=486698 RepID=UPI00194F05CC|nr:wax ester/triacylglycerol synthase domain-containing protein [Mycobacterium riyadhense]